MTSVPKRVEASFRFSTDMLARLGEELNPEVDQGLLELVRNAWDADAPSCQVTLESVSEPGGNVRISDDGTGMSVEDIVDGWLVLGRSGKSRARTTGTGRLVIGDKGLGRLAALRLGEEAVLRTRPAGEGVEHTVVLNWSRFGSSTVVEAVPIDISTAPSRRPSGTDVELRRLRQPITPARVRRVARDLILLTDPFGDSTAFRARLTAPEFVELEEQVDKGGYFNAADWRLQARVRDGRASVCVYDGDGRLLVRAGHDDVRRPRGMRGTPRPQPAYDCPDADFELWAFRLGGGPTRGFTPRAGVQITDLRSWLATFGGVHLYHRDLRVRPFGDPGDDWLGMNLSRGQTQEEAVSTNNSIGRMVVRDEHERLLPKTDRIGFVETAAFSDVRDFGKESLRWFQQYRQQVAEKRRKEARKRTDDTYERQRQRTDETLENLPEEHREEARQNVEAERRGAARYAEHLREEILLYRGLATVGAATVLYAHEWYKPAGQMRDLLAELDASGRETFDSQYEMTLGPVVRQLERVNDGLVAYTRLPLALLRQEKRRRSQFRVMPVVREAVELMEYSLAKSSVHVEIDHDGGPDLVLGTPAALQIAVVNLLVNSMQAFVAARTDVARRRIAVTLRATDDPRRPLALTVSDNGPGLDATLDPDEIWALGRTSTQDGTGVGLTIVRDVVDELAGEATVRSPGDLGGATFQIRMPLVG